MKQSTNFILTIAFAGSVMLRRRWLLCTLLVAVALRTAIVTTFLARDDIPHYSFEIGRPRWPRRSSSWRVASPS